MCLMKCAVVTVALTLGLSACATVETSTRKVPFDLATVSGGAQSGDLSRAYTASDLVMSDLPHATDLE